MPAVSWLDAAVAAADGLRPLDLWSGSSCMVLGRWVGEWPLGVDPRPSFLENVRDRLDFSGCEDVVVGGESSGGCISGVVTVCCRAGAYGRGSDRSFACLNRGSISCRNFR